jgi:hypothetical protein
MTAPRIPASVRKRAEALGDGVLDEGLERQVRALAVCEYIADTDDWLWTGTPKDLARWAIHGDTAEPGARGRE